MRKLLVSLLFLCIADTAFAQCTGLFAVGQVCGNPSGSASAPPSGTASPIIGTQVTVPVVIGGTGAASTLSLRATSGAGGGSEAILLQGGTNGGVQIGRFGISGSSRTLSLGVANTSLGQILLTGSTSGTVTITPQTSAGTATFTLPNTSGTPAISVPSPLSLSASTGAVTWSGMTSDGILFASSATAVGTNRCTMDSNSSIGCSSSTSTAPVQSLTNTTADAAGPNIFLQKNRTGGNTNTSDTLGTITFLGFANSAQRGSGRIQSTQTGASSGSNIPTQIAISTSNSSGLLNQSLIFDGKAHLGVTASGTPSLTAGCNGTNSSSSGSDTAGTFVGRDDIGTTTCTLTFATAYASAPHCSVTSWNTPVLTMTVSTTTLVETHASAAGAKFSYVCFGN